MRVLPLFTRGHDCPRCGHRTDRIRTPFYLRPVRLMFPDARRRACSSVVCFWRGFSFPAQAERASDVLHAAGRPAA